MVNHFDRPEFQQALKNQVGTNIRTSETLQQEMMYVAIPLIRDEIAYGVVRVSLPTTSIDQELSSIQLKIVLGGLLIAVLAAGTSLLISRRISRPIEEMKEIADYFANGDFGHRLTVPDSEELASLADALNQMATQLDHRIQTIISQRNELETVLAGMLEGVEEGDGAPQRVPDQHHIAVVPLPDVFPQPVDVASDAGAGLPLGMAREIDGVGIREEPRLMVPGLLGATRTVHEDQLHSRPSSLRSFLADDKMKIVVGTLLSNKPLSNQWK